ncbi:MAG: potassium transporter TrkG [bacterium]
MILRPTLNDIKIIGFYLSKIMIGIAIAMIVPFFVSIIYKEWNPCLDYLIGIFFSLSLAFIVNFLCYTKKKLLFKNALIITSLSWLVAMFLSAIPLFFSNHFYSYLDACFETMSGFATTGLSLACDLDHLAMGHNMWRHFIMFIGGQGIVIGVLLVIGKTTGALGMYIGEAREEKILPNILGTAKFIWIVSIFYVALSSIFLWISFCKGGLKWDLSLFHSIWIAMAGWDTGGFGPQSQNILFYHNFWAEVIIIVTMLTGAINFALHYVVWNGTKKEIYKNIEIKIFVMTIFFTFFITLIGLIKMADYNNTLILFRKGFFHLISAHTGTGYGTLYATQFSKNWTQLATYGLIIAMGIGGCACSTTGGIKTLRIGIILKVFYQQIKTTISSDMSIFISKIHHIKNLILDDAMAKNALLITFCYFIIYFLGTIVGMFYNYSFIDSLFESTSAAANVGLSCGITTPSMPCLLKIIYIFEMWAGRLEFVSIFAFIGFFVALIKGKK